MTTQEIKEEIIIQQNAAFFHDLKKNYFNKQEIERNSLILIKKYGSDGKESTCNMEDLGLIPGLGKSPGEGKGYPLQYSSLENSIDRGAWRATVHGVAKGQT